MSAPRRYDVGVGSVVSIFVSDDAPDDVLSRTGLPDFPYRFRFPNDVYEHLAYNAVANGVEDANRLDGWADLEPGVLTMRVEVDHTEVI